MELFCWSDNSIIHIIVELFPLILMNIITFLYVAWFKSYDKKSYKDSESIPTAVGPPLFVSLPGELRSPIAFPCLSQGGSPDGRRPCILYE